MRHGRSFVDRNRAVFVDVRDDERSIGYQTSLRAKLLWYSNHDAVTDIVKVRKALVVFSVAIDENRVESLLGYVAPVCFLELACDHVLAKDELARRCVDQAMRSKCCDN